MSSLKCEHQKHDTHATPLLTPVAAVGTIIDDVDGDDEDDDLTSSINFTNMSLLEAMIEVNNHEVASFNP